jgi:phosphopantetheinyl transferase (holo-ACP synthase)
MAVTIEQIREGIAENAELKTQILTDFDSELPEYVKGKGFIVRTADDDEKEFGKRLGPKTAELYGAIEKDVLDTLGKYGLKKDANTEKIYDIIKKAGPLIDAKIKDLEDKLKLATEGRTDEVTRLKIEAYEKQVTDLKAEKETLSSTFSAKEAGYKVNGQLDRAYVELQITVPAQVAEKDKADFIKEKQAQQKALFLSKYKIEDKDGKTVFTDSEGNIQMNGTEVADAKFLLSKDFKYDFAVAEKSGSGSKGGKGELVTLTSKQGVYDQLAKEGLTMGSPDYLKRYAELAEHNKIS